MTTSDAMAAAIKDALNAARLAEQEAAEAVRDAIEDHEAAVQRRIRLQLRELDSPSAALKLLARLACVSPRASSPATEIILTIEAEAALKAMSEVRL